MNGYKKNKKKTTLRREIIKLSLTMWLQTEVVSRDVLFFFISHSLTEQAVVGELKRISANPHRDLYLNKYYRNIISGAKELSRNVESLDKTILQR